jgi:hypothetical protein
MDNNNGFNKVPTKPKQDKTGDWFAIAAVIVILGIAVSNSSQINQTDNQNTPQQQINNFDAQSIEGPVTDTTFLFFDKLFEKQR